jgi:hypothetical protein
MLSAQEPSGFVHNLERIFGSAPFAKILCTGRHPSVRGCRVAAAVGARTG